jgi:hypothetical protein
MDDEEIRDLFATLTKQLMEVVGQLNGLHASVNVLKVSLANEMNPAEPVEALELFGKLEEKCLNYDPQEKERKRASEILDAVTLWKRHGKYEA